MIGESKNHEMIRQTLDLAKLTPLKKLPKELTNHNRNLQNKIKILKNIIENL